jgi:prevent-host-death family protein
MTTVTIHVAKTNLSSLIARACKGETVVIARGNEPVVQLVPVRGREVRRQFGALKGKVRVPEAFFGPLTEAELRAWER